MSRMKPDRNLPKKRPVARPKPILRPYSSVTPRPSASLPGVACHAEHSHKAKYSHGTRIHTSHSEGNTRNGTMPPGCMASGTTDEPATIRYSTTNTGERIKPSIRYAATRRQKPACMPRSWQWVGSRCREAVMVRCPPDSRADGRRTLHRLHVAQRYTRSSGQI